MRDFRSTVTDPERLAALHRYDVVDTPNEEAFDHLADLAAHLLQAPMAGIHFIDDACQWAKAQVGMNARRVGLDVSFCARGLGDQELLVVPDATDDPRFQDNPAVTGEPGIRFYAGAALITPDGYAIGRLCVIDTSARPEGLSDRDRETLDKLATVVMDKLGYRVRRQEREEQLRLMSRAVEDAAEAVVITEGAPLDADGPRIEYVNPAFEAMTGYTAEEVIGKTPRLLQGPETDRATLDAVRSHLERGQPLEATTTINYRKDGTPFWVEWNITPVRGEDGQIDHWVSVQRDVTEQRTRERTLRETRKMLDQVIGTANIGICVTDEAGRFVRVNEAYTALYGWSEDELMGQPFTQVVPPGDRERAQYAHDRFIYDAVDETTGEWTVQRKDGTHRTVVATAGRFTNEAGDRFKVTTVLDITDRKRAERELAKREEYLSVTLNSIGDAVIATDTAGCITRMNDVAETLTDWSADEAKGRPLDEVFVIHNTRTGEPLNSPVDDVLRRGETVGLANHTVLTARDGTERQVDHSAAPIRRAGSGLLGVVLVFRDVTEAHQRREALEAQRERLEMALIGGRVGMWDWDMQSGATVHDERWAAILGYTLDEVEFDNSFFERHTHPDDLERVANDITRHAAGEIPYLDQEIRMRHRDGTWRWVLDRARIVDWAEDGTPLRMVGTHVDITDRHEMESKLRRSESLFRSFAEQAVDVVALFDADGTFKYVSPSITEVTGYPRDELIGQNGFAPVHPRDLKAVRAAFQQAISQPGTTAEVQSRYQHKDGSWRHLSIRGRRLPTSDADVEVLANVRDVTEQKQREAELVRARRRAEEMSQLKSSFLANMSHEIRTPLTSIIGFADVLQGMLSGQEAELLSTIRQGGKRLERTLTSVLDLAQLESQTIEVEADEIDLAEEVHEAAMLFRREARDKGLALDIDVPDRPVPAALDRGAVERILANLLSNAIKFTEEGRVQARLHAGATRAVIEIEDTGIGIEPDYADKVFEEFTQESEGYTRAYEGVGLGLHITQRLVELLGGEIGLQSTKGEGSVFTVTLPALSSPPPVKDSSTRGDESRDALSGQPPTASASDPPSDAGVPGAAVHLLLVDDNPQSRDLFPLLLGEIDPRFVVDVAATAEDALAQTATTHYDGFVVDISLATETNGVELMHELKAAPIHANTPMLACTAHALPGDKERLLNEGFDAYLSKPYRMEGLLAVIQSLFADD